MTGSTRAVLSLLLLVALGVSCGDDSTGPLVPAKIIIIPNQPVIGQGLTLQLTATVVDATGHAMNGEQASFSSDSPAIVDISPTGLMTSLGPLGDALITADDNGLTDTVRVRISQRVGGIAVVPSPLSLHRNTTLQLSPTATDVAGDAIPNNSSFSFTSSDATIATVDQAGLVTAPGPTGVATISVALDTFKIDVPVTVYARPTTIQVTPTSIVVRPSGSAQLSAEVMDSLGDPILGSLVTYTSQDPALFSVSTSGLVTAQAATGAGIVKLQTGTVKKSVPVIVGNGILGTITATTTLPNAGYGIAVGPGGEVFAGLLERTTVVHGTLPSHNLGGPLVVGDGPLGMAINPAGTRAYVAVNGDRTGNKLVAVVDIPGNTVLQPITGFGTTPLTVAVSPDNLMLYVGTVDKVYFIDATTRVFLDSIPASMALHMAVHPSQPLLYVSMHTGAKVVEINTNTRQIVRTFGSPGPIQAIGLSPAGDQLYLAVENGVVTLPNSSGRLKVYDLASGQRTATIGLVGGGFGIGVTDDVVIVAEADAGNIEVFDRATLQRRSLLTPGGIPRRVATNSAGTVAVVANEGGWVDFVE